MKTPSAYQQSFDKTIFNPILLKEVFIMDETDIMDEEDLFDDFEEIESTIHPSGFNEFINSECSEFEMV
ncbi:MAG: hypothetical protein WAQ28_02140 [Bacteroidia bacterium]|jgi:hypothetical protein